MGQGFLIMCWFVHMLPSAIQSPLNGTKAPAGRLSMSLCSKTSKRQAECDPEVSISL